MKTLLLLVSLLLASIPTNAAILFGDDPGDMFRPGWSTQNNNPFRLINGLNNNATNRFGENLMPTTMATDAEVANVVSNSIAAHAASGKMFVLTNTVVASSTNYTYFSDAESRLAVKDVIRFTASGYCSSEFGAKVYMVAGVSALEFDLADYVGYWRLSGTVTARSSGFALEAVMHKGSTTLMHSGISTEDITELNPFGLVGKVNVSGPGLSDYVDCSTMLIEKL